jgi:hypothetical protein
MRFGQAELLADAVDVIVGGAVARDHGRRVAGGEPQDQEDDHGDDEEDGDQG